MNAQSFDEPHPNKYWLATDDELASIASHLGMALTKDASQELDANFSRVFILGSDNGEQRVLKVRARWMTEKRIRFEHTLAQHLRDKGLPIVTPLVGEDGSTWTKVGDLYCEIATFVDGQDAGPYLDGVGRMGELLGYFHQYSLSLEADLYEPPHFQNQTEPKDLEQEVEQLLQQSYNTRDEYTSQIKSIYARVQELKARYGYRCALLPQVIRHGDFHPWNLLFSRTAPSQVVALFDFDMAAQGPRIFDIAYTIFFLRNLHPEGYGDEWNTRYQRFIESYVETSGMPLHQDEVGILPVLMECIALGFVVRETCDRWIDEYNNYIDFIGWLQHWGSILTERLGE